MVVVGLMMVVGVVMMVGLVGLVTTVHLDRSSGQPGRRVVAWSGVDRVPAVQRPGPGRPVLLVGREAVVLVAKHLGSAQLYRQWVAVAPVRSEADRLQCLLFIISGL